MLVAVVLVIGASAAFAFSMVLPCVFAELQQANGRDTISSTTTYTPLVLGVYSYIFYHPPELYSAIPIRLEGVPPDFELIYPNYINEPWIELDREE